MQSVVRYAPDYFVGEIADVVKDSSSWATDGRAMFLVVVGVVGALSAYGFRVLAQRCAQGAMYLMRRRVFQRLSRLGIDFYDRELPGEVAARVVYDLDVLQTFVSQALFLFFTTVATIIAGLAVILVISPVVFPTVAAVMGFIALATVVQYPLSTRAYNHARRTLGVVTSTFEEDFNARDAIRSYDAVPRQTKRFVARSWQLRDARRRVEVINAIFSRPLAIRLAGPRGPGAVPLRQFVVRRHHQRRFGADAAPRRDQRGHARSAASRASTRCCCRCASPGAGSRRSSTCRSCRSNATTRRSVRRCGGDIEFDGVAFGYPHTGRPVLHDVSFRIPAGTTVSMVGYTGAGKSTIAKLLLRTYDPDAGTVRVDGTDLRDFDAGVVSPAHRRRSAGRVSVQGHRRVQHRLRPPRRVARRRRSRGRVPCAPTTCCARCRRATKPRVEEEGKNLTAAQRQLIALARAWLAGPDVLVLDEATSCLDARLERRVLEAVSELHCTTVMVTHRDNVVAASDLVVVLEAGRVVEMGEPAELRGAGGAYDRLWVQEPDGDRCRAAHSSRRR